MLEESIHSSRLNVSYCAHMDLESIRLTIEPTFLLEGSNGTLKWRRQDSGGALVFRFNACPFRD